MSKSISRVMKEKGMEFKPLVYICAPFSGDVEVNIKNAVKLAELAYQKGCIPLTPHLLFPFMDDENKKHRKDAMFMDIILLGKCQELWVLGDEITQGMEKEIQVATERRQTIKYFNHDLVEVTYETNDLFI
ncbi:hypothetical protein J2T50_000280 [Streptococcus gallinaceus]|uniref:DUF4406 domain-containing protein n=1 Tax=Streptococcus gallinaceus TaxID=165758 RepID=UPI00209FC143|nr:DUF4406 domain-containing protein [Streptococcus gallinaceus]MCP1638587.1 hypothetical protein [Streptococcus gallinaceus]MCP1769326.1 hypothetical protein [Streptococcus gallinaceus]